MSKTTTAQRECVGCGQLVADGGATPVCPKCSGAERAQVKAERREARQAPAAPGIPRGIVAPQRRFIRHQVGDDLPVICYECHATVPVGADYFREDGTGLIFCEPCRERMPNTFSRPAAATPQPTAAYAEEIPLVVSIDTTAIRPSPRNPRAFDAADDSDLAELVESIRQHGVLEPIVVRPVSEGEPCVEEYELIAGERRWRASVLAGRATVPARVIDGLDDQTALKLTLLENLQRKDLNPLEEAVGYRALAELGLKQTEIAAAVNRQQPAIAKRLGLLELPPDVQQRIRAGELSPAHGAALAKYRRFPAFASHVAEMAVQQQWPSKYLEGELPYGNYPPKLARELGSFGTPFDTTICKQCPFSAHIGRYCLHPVHYDELAAAAVADRQAKVAAALEAAQAGDGPAVVDVAQLDYRDYRRLSDRPPAGCTVACPCRGQTVDRDGVARPICTDPKRFTKLEKADLKAQALERRERLEVAMVELAERIDGLEEITSRELAPIVALALTQVHGTEYTRGALERHAPELVDVNDQQTSYAWRDRFAELARLPVLALTRLALEALLREGMAGEVQGYHWNERRSLLQWYAPEAIASAEPAGAGAAEEAICEACGATVQSYPCDACGDPVFCCPHCVETPDEDPAPNLCEECAAARAADVPAGLEV